ncbi:MAG: hypothetical protein ABEK10_00270 [Candidatus Nanosalina sp.]
MSVVEGLNLSYTRSVSREEVEEARDRKAEHVYTAFVQPLLEEYSGRKIFQPNEIQDDIRPPYSYREVKDALEYASGETEEIEYVEEDMDLFLYTE